MSQLKVVSYIGDRSVHLLTPGRRNTPHHFVSSRGTTIILPQNHVQYCFCIVDLLSDYPTLNICVLLDSHIHQIFIWKFMMNL